MAQKKVAPKRTAVAAATDEAPSTDHAITTRAEAEAHVRATVGRCMGTRDTAKYAEWQKFMDKGQVEEARSLQTRKGCGYEYAELVIAEPFDGEEHDVTCPKCGNKSSFRAPLFADLDD